MDKATVVGGLAAVALILMGILTGGPLTIFIDPASVLIVLGGTMGVVFMAFPGGKVIEALKSLKVALKFDVPDAEGLVKKLSELSDHARREGLLSLEAAADQTDDEFLQRGLRMMADGHEVDTVEGVLYDEVAKIEERHKVNIQVFEGIAAFAPAMGMIGTLIGLVQMLQNLSDPSAIGPAMAVALLTTFYGSLVANLFGLPIASKLKMRNQQEVAYKELMIQGLVSILNGEPPRFMVERLNSTLAERDRYQEAA